MEGEMRSQYVWRPFLGITLLSFGLSACGGAPKLPPADTMDFIRFDQSQSNALTSSSTNYVSTARAAVGLVSLGVGAFLVVPKLTFAGVVGTKPKSDGDAWVWTKEYPLWGWKAELRGKKDDALELEMRVSGTRADNSNIQDFLWYRGTHYANSGMWEMYAPDKTGPVLRIDWRRASATDKDLTFTIVEADSPKLDDQLAYSLKDTLASMIIHDERGGSDDSGGPEEFSVTWDTQSGAGQMVDKAQVSYCWDTLANGQGDMDACPSDWP